MATPKRRIQAEVTGSTTRLRASVKRQRGRPLAPDAKKLLRNLREHSNLTPAELAAKARISSRTLLDMENPSSRKQRFDIKYIERVACALGISPDLLTKFEPPKSLATSSIIPDFESLNNRLQDVDQCLLDIVRQIVGIQPSLIEDTYQHVLQTYLARAGIDLTNLLQLAHAHDFLKTIATTLPPPSLAIEVEERLRAIVYRHEDGEIALRSPSLLWDCSCRTLGADSNTHNCRIHSPDKLLGDKVEDGFYGRSVLIRHRGLGFRWRDSRPLWPPSIDSFLLLQDLEHDGVFRHAYDRVLDLGSGTGMLGLTIAAHGRVRELDLVDWLLSPLLYACVNMELNREYLKRVRVRAHLRLIQKDVTLTDKYDLVICNPPFLPSIPGYDEIGIISAVSSTDLFVALIRNAKQLGGRCYVRLSSITRNEATEAANACN